MRIVKAKNALCVVSLFFMITLVGCDWLFNYGGSASGRIKKVSVTLQFSKISAGKDYTAAIDKNGYLYAWGRNAYGQLGDGSTTDRDTPTQIGTDAWKSAAAGRSYTMALKNDGSLWAWGRNDYGQLGDGTTTNRLNPVQIGTDVSWQQVFPGDSHTLAIDSGGNLYAWGNNASGQLGLGESSPGIKPTPTRIDTIGQTWKVVSTGSRHTLAIDSYGNLYAWGHNGSGQLGLKDDRSIIQKNPTLVVNGKTWKDVSAGNDYTLAIDSGGNLYAWGRNNFGQLGDGSTTNRWTPVQIGTDKWKSVLTGDKYTAAVKRDGSLWVWGDNGFGQLGDGADGNTSYNKSPVQIGTDRTWKRISAGRRHMAAMQGDESLWTWGNNEFGQLGDGTKTNKRDPAQITTAYSNTGTPQFFPLPEPAFSAGWNDTVSIDRDGKLWAWGYNKFGQLGDGTKTNRTSPIPIRPESTWKSVSAGLKHTAAIDNSGKLWTWGNNEFGQLGDGNSGNDSGKTVPIPIRPESTWRRVSAGSYHTAAIDSDGKLWTWGYNRFGQLGDGGYNSYRPTPAQIGTDTNWRSVSAERTHTMAIKNDGSLWAWGAHSSSLQFEDRKGKKTPTPIKPGSTWKSISSGDSHTMAIKSDGSLWGWGGNYYGQLGDGTTASKTALTQVGTDTDWKIVSVGEIHTLAIKNDGSLWAWGYNDARPLGESSNADRHSPARVGTDTDWESISAGNFHMIARKTDGSLWIWGYILYGQLGNGKNGLKSYKNHPVKIKD